MNETMLLLEKIKKLESRLGELERKEYSIGCSSAHAILSSIHSDALAASVVAGDVIFGNATPRWSRLALSAPAANIRNVFGVDNGETLPSWKAALDGTAPTTIAENAAGAAGTSLVFAHRDHTHGAPATWAATAHNLLSTSHGDTLGASVVAGDVLIGNGTPKWARFGLSVPAANVRNVFGVDNGETLPSWKAALDATVPTTIAENATAAAGASLVFAHRDHTHGAPATWAATAHNLLSTSHGDTLAGSVADGDIIIGNGTPKWSRLGISIPNSTFINLVGVGYGETRPSWKPAFDATVPSTINWSDAAAAGSATVFARRDHVHGAPANPGLTAHGLISATHNDTTGTGAPSVGDIIVAAGAPCVWGRLPVSVPVSDYLRNTLSLIKGDIYPIWRESLDSTNPSTISVGATASPGTSYIYSHRDHVHAAPATWTPSAHTHTFVGGLSDVPANYSGSAYKLVRVNAAANALEFSTYLDTYAYMATSSLVLDVVSVSPLGLYWKNGATVLGSILGAQDGSVVIQGKSGANTSTHTLNPTNQSFSVGATVALEMTSTLLTWGVNWRCDFPPNYDEIFDVTSGWFAFLTTCTYASATTFTVSGNFTTLFTAGMKLRLTQTTTKYFYVIHSSYSSPNTTVTICAGDVYTLANAAISGVYLSRVENPEGFPDYFHYAPVWTCTTGTAPSLGNGALNGSFKLVGKDCRFKLYFAPGSTSTFGNGGNFEFTLPFTVPTNPDTDASGLNHYMMGHVRNAATANYPIQAQFNYGTNASKLTLLASMTAGTNNNFLTNSVPITWTSSVSLHVDGWFRYYP